MRLAESQFRSALHSTHRAQCLETRLADTHLYSQDSTSRGKGIGNSKFQMLGLVCLKEKSVGQLDSSAGKSTGHTS